MNSHIGTKIENLYRKAGFYGQYGGDLALTITVLVVLLLAVSAVWYFRTYPSLRNNWPSNRYKPEVMPFAGYIMPEKNKTAWDVTEENFESYLVLLGQDVLDIALQAQRYLVAAVAAVAKFVGETIEALRKLMDIIRTAIMNAVLYIISIISGVVASTTIVANVMTTIMEKVGGTFIAMLYTIQGIVLTSDGVIVGSFRLLVDSAIALGVTIIVTTGLAIAAAVAVAAAGPFAAFAAAALADLVAADLGFIFLFGLQSRYLSYCISYWMTIWECNSSRQFSFVPAAPNVHVPGH